MSKKEETKEERRERFKRIRKSKRTHNKVQGTICNCRVVGIATSKPRVCVLGCPIHNPKAFNR